VSVLKSTGIVRALDNLGRIVLPKEMRTLMDIEGGDAMEIFIDMDKNMLVLRKYTGVSCKMCESLDNLTYFKDSFLCSRCIGEIKAGDCFETAFTETKSDVPSKSVRSEELINKLKQIMLERPGLTQRQYGNALGVSQCRVSQLMRGI
jgi:transcriptional pleiotropic regulator of transition state genes